MHNDTFSQMSNERNLRAKSIMANIFLVRLIHCSNVFPVTAAICKQNGVENK